MPQLERFVYHVIEVLKPGIRGKELVSLSTIRGLMWGLLRRCHFRFPDFKLGHHGLLRIDNAIEKLVQDKLIIRGRWHQRQWIGYSLTRTILVSWFAHGLDQGVLSWDVHLLRALAVVLMSACGCRAGEIVRSYPSVGSLTWDDITIMLDGGFQLRNLMVEIKIRWEKGSK